jgi:hypothetical protein
VVGRRRKDRYAGGRGGLREHEVLPKGMAISSLKSDPMPLVQKSPNRVIRIQPLSEGMERAASAPNFTVKIESQGRTSDVRKMGNITSR